MDLHLATGPISTAGTKENLKTQNYHHGCLDCMQSDSAFGELIEVKEESQGNEHHEMNLRHCGGTTK